VVVDLGCGAGDMLGRMEASIRRPVKGRPTDEGRAIGIDLARAAVARAAKAWPTATWIVANADRRLPLLEGSVALVASVHARRNPVECARVLKAGGWLLVTVPAPDDLIELRASLLGARVERDRAALVIAEHDAHFTLERHHEHRERLTLDASQLGDVLTGTYRGARNAVRADRAALEALTVTLASEILLFRTRGAAPPGAP
jgi:23S rRNA (guanine745-N1)-methyltransferase